MHRLSTNGPGLRAVSNVVHRHLRAEVANAHSGLAEPVNERSEGLSLLLTNADQGYGCQMVGAAGCELDVELGYQCFEAVY